MARLPLPPGVDDTPVFHTANRLHSAAIHLLRWVRTADRETGLSPERLSILSILSFAGPKNVGEIAELEMVSAPAVSRILNGLEGDGLVARKRVKGDRRYVRVIATAKGRRLMESARARRLDRMATKLETLSDKELGALRKATEILERLEAPTAAAGPEAT
jgi:DNA-binding MarR family transcriptional regulator